MVHPFSLWSPVEARCDISAPPDEVFAIIAEPRTYPDWLVGAQRIRGVDDSFPAKGAEFDHSVGPTEATTIDDSTEVRSVDPPHRLSLLAKAGPFHADVDLLVLPTQAGSEVRFRERPPGWGVALTPFLRPTLHARNVESLRRLSELIEGRQPSEAHG